MRVGNDECIDVLLCDDSACGSEHVCTLVGMLVSSLEVIKRKGPEEIKIGTHPTHVEISLACFPQARGSHTLRSTLK